jgi:hypothetical protein
MLWKATQRGRKNDVRTVDTNFNHTHSWQIIDVEVVGVAAFLTGLFIAFEIK